MLYFPLRIRTDAYAQMEKFVTSDPSCRKLVNKLYTSHNSCYTESVINNSACKTTCHKSVEWEEF